MTTSPFDLADQAEAIIDVDEGDCLVAITLALIGLCRAAGEIQHTLAAIEARNADNGVSDEQSA